MNLREWQPRKKKTPQSQPDPDFQHKEEKHWSQERNSHSAKAAENWVCSVCLCGACVWALIKDRRFFKHIRAILSNCFTPSSISTRTKDTDCGTKRCSPALLLLYHTEQAQCRHKQAGTRGIMLLCSSSSSRRRRRSVSVTSYHCKGRWSVDTQREKGNKRVFSYSQPLRFILFLSNSRLVKKKKYIRFRSLTKDICIISLIHSVVAELKGSVIDTVVVPETHFCSPQCTRVKKINKKSVQH